MPLNHIYATISALLPPVNAPWEATAQTAIATAPLAGYSIFRECGAFGGFFATRVDFLFVHLTGPPHTVIELKCLYGPYTLAQVNNILFDVGRLHNASQVHGAVFFHYFSVVLTWNAPALVGAAAPGTINYYSGGPGVHVAVPANPLAAPNLFLANTQFNSQMFGNAAFAFPNPYNIWKAPLSPLYMFVLRV